MVRWMLVLFNPLATWEDDPKTHIFNRGVKPAPGLSMFFFLNIFKTL